LIISQLGTLPQGRVSSVPVGSPDPVQTFFAQAGIPIPWMMHGRDISSVLKDPEQTNDTTVLLFEHMGHRYGSETNTIPTDDTIYHNDVPRWIAIRKGPWKYVRTLIAGEMEEIYNLRSDPDELRNLALRQEHANLLQELRQEAIMELRLADAHFVDQLPVTRQMQ